MNTDINITALFNNLERAEKDFVNIIILEESPQLGILRKSNGEGICVRLYTSNDFKQNHRLVTELAQAIKHNRAGTLSHGKVRLHRDHIQKLHAEKSNNIEQQLANLKFHIVNANPENATFQAEVINDDLFDKFIEDALFCEQFLQSEKTEKEKTEQQTSSISYQNKMPVSSKTVKQRLPAGSTTARKTASSREAIAQATKTTRRQNELRIEEDKRKTKIEDEKKQLFVDRELLKGENLKHDIDNQDISKEKRKDSPKKIE